MIDMEISLNSLAATLLWILGLGLLTLAFITDLELSSFGLFCAVAGGVLNVRGSVHRLSMREKNAYDLGRESVRAIR